MSVVPGNDECEYAIGKLQEYLRIPTVQPQPDYEQCTRFLLEVWMRACPHTRDGWMGPLYVDGPRARITMSSS